jgi:hypothetical protein
MFICCILFLFINSAHSATIVPSWFDANDYDLSSSSVLGRTDVDLIQTVIFFPNLVREFIVKNDIIPGTEFFAWTKTDSQHIGNLSLTQWNSLDAIVARENRFDRASIISTDTSASPLGGPAIFGFVDPNQDVILCIHHISDPNCAYENSFALQDSDIPYTWYLKFEPSPVPLPAGIWFLLTGIIGLFGFHKVHLKQ